MDALGNFFIERTIAEPPELVFFNYYFSNRSLCVDRTSLLVSNFGSFAMAGNGAEYGFGGTYYNRLGQLKGTTMSDEKFHYFDGVLFESSGAKKAKVSASGADYVFSYVVKDVIYRTLFSKHMVDLEPVFPVTSGEASLIDFASISTSNRTTWYAYLYAFGNGTTTFSIESVGGPNPIDPLPIANRKIRLGKNIEMNALLGGHIPVVWSEGAADQSIYFAIFDAALNTIFSEESLYMCRNCVISHLGIAQIGEGNDFLLSFLEGPLGKKKNIPKALIWKDGFGPSDPFFFGKKEPQMPDEGHFVSQQVHPQGGGMLQVYTYNRNPENGSHPTYVGMRFFHFSEKITEMPSLPSNPTDLPTPSPHPEPTDFPTRLYHPNPTPIGRLGPTPLLLRWPHSDPSIAPIDSSTDGNQASMVHRWGPLGMASILYLILVA